VGLPGGPARVLKTRHTIAAIVLAAVVVTSVTGFVWAKKRVAVIVDGTVTEITTQSDTVASLLAEVGVRYTSTDLVSPAPRTEISDGDTVVIRHAVPVTLSIAGEKLRLNVVGRTVADALLAAGLDPTSGMQSDPPVETALEPDMEIAATDVFIRVVEEEAEVPYNVVVLGDPKLPAGSRKTVTPGSIGRTLRIFQVLVVGGVEGPRFLKAEKALAEPVTEVVSLGTQRQFRQVMVSRGAVRANAAPPTPALSSGQTRIMRATAYTPWDAGCGGIKVIASRKSRYRIPDGWGVIAVDPHVIPLGTKMFVEGYGYAIAADTGGAIKGDLIDVCYWGRDLNASVTTDGEAQRAAAHAASGRWGMRNSVRVTILGK
jgi:uncharacterized protein YabE (DUF348 family)/3D (Asp-Asp-Asp) domain-containing protein